MLSFGALRVGEIIESLEGLTDVGKRFGSFLDFDVSLWASMLKDFCNYPLGLNVLNWSSFI